FTIPGVVSGGWDALNDCFCNMLEAGIVDPAKVTRLTIELSASVAALLLTTEAIITDDINNKSATPSMQGADY
ncbi:MAG: hypothetical protein V4489_01470, partial [Chlamydiota bacterium]